MPEATLEQRMTALEEAMRALQKGMKARNPTADWLDRVIGLEKVSGTDLLLVGTAFRAESRFQAPRVRRVSGQWSVVGRRSRVLGSGTKPTLDPKTKPAAFTRCAGGRELLREGIVVAG